MLFDNTTKAFPLWELNYFFRQILQEKIVLFC